MQLDGSQGKVWEGDHAHEIGDSGPDNTGHSGSGQIERDAEQREWKREPRHERFPGQGAGDQEPERDREDDQPGRGTCHRDGADRLSSPPDEIGRDQRDREAVGQARKRNPLNGHLGDDGSVEDDESHHGGGHGQPARAGGRDVGARPDGEGEAVRRSGWHSGRVVHAMGVTLHRGR